MKNTFVSSILVILFILLTSSFVSAAPRVLCLESDGTSIKVRAQRGCLRRGGTVIDLNNFEKEDSTVCYGMVDGESPAAVQTYGGSKTTNVSVVQSIFLGSYQIICEGDFTGISSVDDLTIIVTPRANYNVLAGVASATVSTAVTDTTLSFYVNTWLDSSSGNASLSNESFSFQVLTN